MDRSCARYIYVVPDGLRELMSDISREVLRSQPDDIYTFLADYLDALLITRENARVSAKFVQHMADAAEITVDLLNRTGMTREEADRAADVIQNAFKAWTERKGILKEDEDNIVTRIVEEAGISEFKAETAATVIQTAFRMFKTRQQRESQLLSGIIDWRVAARSAIRLYKRTGVTPAEAARAATLIKAAYKGYYTRRNVRLLNQGAEGERDYDTWSSEESFSLASIEEEEEFKFRPKEVRIDFESVVPRVDFGDEELIVQPIEEETSVVDEVEEAPAEKTSEEFIRELLEDQLSRVAEERPPSVEEEEEVVPSVLSSMIQEQLEQQLEEEQTTERTSIY